MIEPQAYNLRVGTEICRAALIAWINGHTAVFYIFGNLGIFKTSETIKVNMHTLDATKYESSTGETGEGDLCS